MKFTKILFIALVIVGLGSCELYDNIDPKEPTSVPPETLFTNAEVNLFNLVDEVSVNFNISRLLAQYWQETTYFTEARYNFADRGIPDNFQIESYRDILQDFKEATNLIMAEDFTGPLAVQRDNQVAIMDICEVYAWSMLVDAFGDVPYSEALDGGNNTTPAYDDAATIYNDIVSILTAAVRNLDGSQGSFGSADLIYDGDITMWKKFGATLLLRLGMRLADVNEAASKQAVADAMSFGVFEAGEEAALYYNGVVPHVNAIYNHFSVDGRKDYVPANTIVDMMNDLEDPRRPLWFTKYQGGYSGAEYGQNAAASFNNYSNFAPQFLEATLPARAADFMEVSFLLAEAVERGYSGVSGTAEEHYNNGITESILQWGGTMDDVNTYLANPKVAYSTAQGNWKQKIGTQKWLAHYNRGVEGWAEWRRLDYPQFNVPEELSYDDIPRRMPYPFDEPELNGANYDAAVGKMGGDNPRIKVFWDVFDPPF